MTISEKTTRVKNKYSWLESLFVLVLGLYPMRHIYIGLDWWDVGYSYANFQYMGTDHMDPMWLFSTYLANGVGNFLMKLPSAGTLAGMNLYTGLFVSGLALAGYFFCTRKLKITPLVAFVGEFVAISLCWCPTAKLYDYLTYVLFLACVILLYQGLLQDNRRYLFIAGICLGANVLVRFSNLPEAALILAVWAYGVIEKEPGSWKRTVQRTLACLSGYLAALAVLFGYIGIVYGLDNYVEGISRLFAMTDTATDYKATSMLFGMVKIYANHLYWLIRIALIGLAGVFGWMMVHLLVKKCKPVATSEKLTKFFYFCCYVASIGLGIVTVIWLYHREFCSWMFFSYDSMLRPGILFLMLTMLIAVLRIFGRNVSKEEKLISGLVLLIVLLTSIGSNNGVYPSINNLFIAAPYTLRQCAAFVSRVGKRELKFGKKFSIVLDPFAMKCVLIAFLALFLFQSSAFGAKFVFAEGTGVQNPVAIVENNEILKGMQMSSEKAEAMETISAYVREKELQGREVIPYGDIPSICYYLQMPPAFNSWSDLESFSVEQMTKEMLLVEEQIAKGKERPVVIADISFATEDKAEDVKWQLIAEFLEKYDYVQTFSNNKFVIWE